MKVFLVAVSGAALLFYAAAPTAISQTAQLSAAYVGMARISSEKLSLFTQD